MTSPISSSTETSTLALHLVREVGGMSMIEQLVLQIRSLIESGRLVSGARLPSSRVLAEELGVSRTVTTESYAILVAEGYLDTKQGSGTFVVERRDRARCEAKTASRRDAAPRWLRRAVEPPAIDPDPQGAASFRICEPDPSSFPDGAWRTAARAAIAEPLPEGYGPAAGDPSLREVIASFIARERGLRCSPGQIVVTSGTTQSLDLVARATLAPGDRVAFEDPGYRLARQILADSGAAIHPVPVDDEGLVVKRLDDSDSPLVVYTTPSHQFPVGSVLSYTRRGELLAWASRHDALVIEDDYDSEFRLDGPALPALAANDENGSVVYLGTFSKALAPSLRVGYLIAPEPLREAILSLKVRTDYHSSWLTQRSLARYIASGAFGKHLRRMRRLYRARRDCLIEALDPLPNGAEWVGLAAGLHATLRLPENLSAVRVAARCRKRGVFVRALADYTFGTRAPNGLVLGYGACSSTRLEDLARVVQWLLSTEKDN